jgi:hypothetical protein
VVETYFQNIRPDADLGTQPSNDQYFLGRMDMSDGVNEKFYAADFGTTFKQRLMSPFKAIASAPKLQIAPEGFSQMIFIDRGGFDREHYNFKFVRREFLGDIRTMMFEVAPKNQKDHGRFLGRIWVEDENYNIVRFNGVYTNPGSRDFYFHMDSWRANVRPGTWVPSHVYSEEQNLQYSAFGHTSFKAQTRLWGYDLHAAGNQQEFSTMTVDGADVKDTAAAASQDSSPVDSFRQWQREAENNVLDKLERAGLLAPEGDVDKVLATVVNNVEITNNLDIQPEVRCRVLLTSPLESFTVGHTIVISRGLLDVLPDEASLAMVLTHELAHIVAGDGDQTQFAFSDKTLFADNHSFHEFSFTRTPQQENDADAKALTLLKNSPYKDKLASAGLFLRQLEARAAGLPQLTTPRIGNGLIADGHVVRMVQLMNSAPELRNRETTQVAALPLGGRIKMDAWDDHVEMSKAKATALISPKEKFPLEITPMTPHLTRTKNAENINTQPNGTKIAANANGGN